MRSLFAVPLLFMVLALFVTGCTVNCTGQGNVPTTKKFKGSAPCQSCAQTPEAPACVETQQVATQQVVARTHTITEQVQETIPQPALVRNVVHSTTHTEAYDPQTGQAVRPREHLHSVNLAPAPLSSPTTGTAPPPQTQ